MESSGKVVSESRYHVTTPEFDSGVGLFHTTFQHVFVIFKKGTNLLCDVNTLGSDLG